MAAQIKTCFERYEKKYRLTAEQQRAILQGMAPYMKRTPTARIPSATFIMIRRTGG